MTTPLKYFSLAEDRPVVASVTFNFISPAELFPHRSSEEMRETFHRGSPELFQKGYLAGSFKLFFARLILLGFPVKLKYGLMSIYQP
jgi:hypothetical protein